MVTMIRNVFRSLLNVMFEPHDEYLRRCYLAQAVDLADLEWRIKELNRGVHSYPLFSVSH